ncbi:MAG: AAA-like domain-containing protein [Capsulimonadales bacterium]|nr:AAA-like domain-containing protein [Capsulimonadales bacterium]
MSPEVTKGYGRINAEIAHVLFVDLVGYSRLSFEDQARITGQLREIVRETPEFVRAEAAGELLRGDSGDGMWMTFFRDPLAPAQCATEIARVLKSERYDQLKVRMGIHSGPVSRVIDINGQLTVTGSGINLAQRVMDCGDAGHILVSERVANDLSEFETWRNCLTDIGEVEVKHGDRIHLFNLRQGEVGNPETPLRVRFRNDRPAYSDDRTVVAPRTKRGPVGGAVPLDSEFYIVRPTDHDFRQHIDDQESIVLVKGGRQMGKTSLLARGLQQARERGARVIFTDFQSLSAVHLASADALYRELANMIADQLDLSVLPEDVWNEKRSPNMNLERYLRKEVFGSFEQPLVWGLDEVDRLFTCSFGSEVFGLFRSWHNRRSLDPTGPWSRMTMAIAYATEAHLFITDLNQSPFNVGKRLTLSDFRAEEVWEMNRRYGSPLRDETDFHRFHDLLGGQPGLTSRGLDEIAARKLDIATFEEQATLEGGLFDDHLRRVLASLSDNPELVQAMRTLLKGEPIPGADHFHILRGAGLVVGDSVATARPRCRLYREYLTRHLL